MLAIRKRSWVSVISVLSWGDRWPRPRACTTSPPISTATDAAEFPFRRSAASRFASKAAQPVGCPLPASSRPGPDGGASSATRTSKGRSGSTSNVGSSVANPSSNVASTTDVTDVARVSGSSARRPVLQVHPQWSAQHRCQPPRSSHSPDPSAALTPRWRSHQILQRTAASGSSGRCRRTLRPSMQQHPVLQHIASLRSTALAHDDRPARRSGGNTPGVLRPRRVAAAAFCTCRRRIRRGATRCP